MLRSPRPGTADEAYRLAGERAGACACFFDFDGTLSPIVTDPDTARPVPGALDALTVLARRLRAVVIVSARPVSFLSEALPGLPDVALYGLYGLEWRAGDGPLHTDPAAAPYEAAMADLAARARAELPTGILVEYKRLSVALHYRSAPRHRAVVEEWAARHATELGLRLQAGRMVVELKPPGDRDKGRVVAERLDGLTCAWYFGDDLSDLRGFAALDEREAADPAFTGVRVAVANAESGQQLSPAADLCLAGPEALPGFLAGLVAALPDRAPHQ